MFEPFDKGYVMTPDAIAVVCGLARSSHVRGIVECGSGLSTIALARVLRERRLPNALTSFEHNEHYRAQTILELHKADLADYADVRLARLGASEHGGIFYEMGLGMPQADIVLVDGPPRLEAGVERANALSIVAKSLPGATVIFDDAFGEERAIRLRALSLHWQAMILPTERGLAVCRRHV